MKLPKELQKFLSDLGGGELFVTSLDGKLGRIYRLPTWDGIADKLAKVTTNKAAAERQLFLGNHFGHVAEIDSQGRVSVSTELRRDLGLEKTKVWMFCSGSRINFLGDAQYQAQVAMAKATAAEDNASLDYLGIE